MLRLALAAALVVALAPAASAKPVIVDDTELETLIDQAKDAVAELSGFIAKMPKALVTPNVKAAMANAKARLVALDKLVRAAADAPAPCTIATPPVPPSAPPMAEAAFGALVAQVKAASFGKDKLTLIRDAATKNDFSVAQAVALMQLLSFPSERLEALTALAPELVDLSPMNKGSILDLFSFAADKARAQALLEP